MEAIALTLLLKVSPIAYTLLTGDFPGAAAFGAEEDSALIDMIFTAREFFTAR
jgi:hypothetical protein